MSAKLAKPPMAWAPWTDKKGRLHLLRLIVFVLLLLPGAWLALRFQLDLLGARRVNSALLSAGWWAAFFLLTSLCITPAKAFVGLPTIVVVRRMVGNAALFYALLHVLLYTADQNWRPLTIAKEIVLRFYLNLGFVALLGLIVLGVTSLEYWVRRLGPDWKRLHRAAYLIAGLAVTHYLLEKKDIFAPMVFVGIFAWLMLWRLLPAGRDRGPLALLGITLAAAALTLFVEWAWLFLRTNLDPMKAVRAELNVGFGLGPAGQIVALGLLALLALQARRLSQGRAGRSPLFWIALFALGAALNEFAVFVFGIDRFLEPDDMTWLWQDLTWAVLLGCLGFVRWRATEGWVRQAVDALALCCIGFQILQSGNGMRGAGIVVALAITALWSVLAWQTRRQTRLAAFSLVPLAAVLLHDLSTLT